MFNFAKEIITFLMLFFFVYQPITVFSQSKLSKSGNKQDEVYCKLLTPELRGFDDRCLNEVYVPTGFEYTVVLKFVVEDYRNILDQYKSFEFIDTLQSSDACSKKGSRKGERNGNCKEAKEIEKKNNELLIGSCKDNSPSLIQIMTDNNLPGKIVPYLRDTESLLRCTAVFSFKDKDSMCSMLSNKLMGHVTKENKKIFPGSIAVQENGSIGEEIRSRVIGSLDIDFWEKSRDTEKDCKKAIDDIFAAKR